VAEVAPDTREVRVAPRARLVTRAVRLADPVWHEPLPSPAEARLRYQGPRFPVHAEGAWVRFLEPGPPLARGQAVVLYDSDRVLGGGTAAEVVRGASESTPETQQPQALAAAGSPSSP